MGTALRLLPCSGNKRTHSFRDLDLVMAALVTTLLLSSVICAGKVATVDPPVIGA